MFNKHLTSVILSAIFIFALLSSTIIAGASIFFINEILAQTLDTAYSVRILSPTLVTVKEKENSANEIQYVVQVARQNSKGQFLVTLSTVSDTPALNMLRSFVPSFTINMEEGQSVKNSTLTIPNPRADSLTPGSYKFQVQANNLRTSPNNIKQETVTAMSNPAALIVIDQDQQGGSGDTSQSQLKSQQAAIGDKQTQEGEQQQQPNQEPQKPNHPPVAKAGRNQQVNEGSNVILDGSASTDQDQGQTLLYSWTLNSKQQQSIKIEQPAPTSPKAKFTAPTVIKDTPLTITLTVRDTSGGESSDTVSVLVRNIVTQDMKDETSQKTPQGQSQNEGQPPKEQETGQTLPPTTTIAGNRPPTAKQSTAAALFTEANKPLAISLEGSDPDKDDKLSFTISSAPSHATIAAFDKTAGTFTFIPNNGFTGKDSFKYKVIDSSGAESNEATVVVNVGKPTAGEGKEADEEPAASTDLTGSPSESSNLANVSKAVEDRLKFRQEILDSKLRDTQGATISNQYIVILKKDVAPTDTQDLVDDAKSRGAKVLQQYQKAFKGFAINVQNKDELADILNNSEVAYAEPDVKVKVFAQTLPTGVDRVDGDLSSALSGDGKGDAINADIAVLDTGIDLKHPDLDVYKHVTLVPGTTTGNDDNGHGTMVAGIAAAKDNGWGSVGIAPGARLWSVKVLDSSGTGSLSSVLQGLDFVTANANELEVADLSFGCENCVSQTLNTALENAISAGVTIVAAAGNGAKDASTFSPANNPNVIAVSAIADSDGKCGAQGDSTSAGADDSLASFSNYGSTIDMAAPGVQIFSTSKNGGYSIMSGTSMAAPHVAGAAALYISQIPNASPAQVLSALKNQGSTSSNDCDAKGHGYFTNDKDSNKVPLLYVGSPSSAAPELPTTQTNNTSSNNTTGTTPTPEPQSTSPSPTNTTNTNNNNTNSNSTIPVPTPATGNVTGDLGNQTGLGNQTEIGNQTSLGNVTSGNQTFHAASGDTWYLLRKIGDGYLTQPHGVDVDSTTGKVYVANTGGHNITVFNSDGSKDTSFGSFGSAGPEDIVFMSNYIVQPSGGGPAVPSPVLVVTDPSNADPALDFYFTNGTLIQHTTGSNLGMTMPNPKPYGIGSITISGGSPPEFYVVDLNHREVSHYFPQPVGGSGIPLHPAPPRMINPNFLTPLDVGCCLTDGVDFHAYVTDVQGGGAGISWYNARPGHEFVDDCCKVSRFPYGIDVIPGTSSSGRFIVSDQTFQEVVSYNSTGAFKGTVSGSGASGVLSPAGIAVVPDQPSGTDTVYVAEHGNSRISVFVNTDPAPPVNQPPVAISQSVTIDEDVAKSMKLNATDADNDDLTYSLPTGSVSAQGGRLENFNSSTGDVTYRPPANFNNNNGQDQFNFEASDGTDTSNLATISINVNPVNDAPVANDDRYTPVYQDSGPTTLAVGQNDSDAELDQFSDLICIDSTTDPPNGSVEIAQECGGALMSVRYTPDPGFVGTDTFNYTITNGESPPLCCDGAKVTVEVVDNVPPTPPVLLFPPHGGSINDNTPTFDWENSNDSSPMFYNLTVDGFNSGRVITEDFLNVSEFTATTALADEGYNWRVIPFDSAGNGGIGYNSVDNFEIDTTPPVPPVISSPANLSSTQNSWIVFDGTAEPPTSGFDTQHVVRIYDNVSGTTSVGNFTMDGSTFDAWSVNVTDLAGGPHSFTATVTDRANNTSPSSEATIVSIATTGSDTTPPIVTASYPPAGFGGISVTPCVCITFSEQMDEATISTSTITLKDPDDNNVTAQVSYDTVNNITSFNPSAPLSYSTEYTATVKGGASGVKDAAGNALVGDHIWTFTTMAQPPESTDPHPFNGRWGSLGQGSGQFAWPDGGGIDSAGNVYIADCNNNNIQKFKADGTFITKWGSFGSGDGQFDCASGIGVDSANNIYVADWYNNRVQKFSSAGVFLAKWGSPGGVESSVPGEFNGADDVAVDSANNIYVTDYFNDRVQKFTSSGSFLTEWGSHGSEDGNFDGVNGIAVDLNNNNVYTTEVGCIFYDTCSEIKGRVQKFTSAGTFITKWGTPGSGNGQFDTPRSIGVDSSGKVYVVDSEHSQIQKFTSTGLFITKWGSVGTANGQFRTPNDISVDQTSGKLYIIDRENARVQVFGVTPDTTSPTVTTTYPDSNETDVSITPCVCITFSEQMDETTINDNNILLSDGENNIPGQVSYDPIRNITSFNPLAPLEYDRTYTATVSGSEGGVSDVGGRELATDYTWSFTTMAQPPTSTDPHPFIGRWGSPGSGNGQFSGNSGGIAADSAGNIYVTDHTDDNVQKFKSDGTFVTKWGTTGTGNSQFNAPFGIVVDSNDDVYVVDHDNNRVQKFTSDGVFITTWGEFGSSDGLFSIPQDIAVDSGDNVYVVDGGSQRVQKFDSDGEFISKFGTSGTGDGQFTLPSGITIDSADNIYVTDRTADRIQKFSSAGAFLTKWGTTGTADSQFNMPYFLDVDSSDNVYVADIENDRVQMFTGNGTFINKFGTSGSDDGQFSAPLDVAIGPINGTNGNAYVLDTQNYRIQVFASQANGKIPTALSIRVPEIVVHDGPFTVSGYLTDITDPENPIEIEGAPITFTGSGAANLQSVSTQGVSFVFNPEVPGDSISISDCASCPSELYDGTTGNKVLHLPEGGFIELPEETTKVRLAFDDMGPGPFSMDLILADESTIHYTDLVGGGYLEKQSVTPIVGIDVVSSPVEYVGISSLVTGDFRGLPEEQRKITFESFDASPSIVSPFVVNASSYYSTGAAPSSAPATFQVEASYAGDATHEAATSGTVSFETSETIPGQGVGDETVVTQDVPVTYNNPSEFTNLCANLITSPGDTDGDGICDAWESPTTTGNTPTQRFITCPQRSGGTFIDVASGTATVDCNNTNPITGATITPAKYNLCHTDMFPGTWSTNAPNNLLCPKVGHKDMFVEIDYTDVKHKPLASAIKDVIMAFGNAPISNTATDDFGRSKGITLHIIVDEDVATTVAEDAPIKAWWDGTVSGLTHPGDDFDSIKLGKPANAADPPTLTDGHFGTLAERQSDPTGRVLDLKHYVYRYGLFAHSWGSASACGASGIAELLGNDLIVSLGGNAQITGCKFGLDGSGHSVGTRSEQAGTLMHELGHTLGLDHGGPIDLGLGSTNYRMNCKANYLSVMQYSRQLPKYIPSGIGTDKWEYTRDAATGDPMPLKVGTSTWPGTALDYSRTALIDLNEAGLKETTGLPRGISTPDDHAATQPAQKFAYAYDANGPAVAGGTTIGLATTGSSVNWDPFTSGIQLDSQTVKSDLNAAGITDCGASPDKLETSGTTSPKSDWANIKLKFLGDADSLDGAGPDSPESRTSNVQEITATMAEQMEDQAEASGIADPPDTTPPNTAIVSAVDGNGNNVAQDATTSSNSITFTFTGSDDVGVSDFECSLDSASFTACDTTETFSSLGDGSHTLQVRARDGSSNVDPSPASRTWTVDAAPPAAPSITSPATGTVTTNNKPPISGTAEASSTVLIFDGANQIGTATANAQSGAWSFTPSTALSEGSHTLTAKARDAAGNTSPASTPVTITIDTVKPTVASTNPTDGATNVVVTANILATFSEAMNPTTITGSTFTLKEGSTTIGGTVSLSTDGKTATFDPTNPLLSSKLYTATITTGVKDVAGNSLAANKVWTFTTQSASDTTPPDTSIGSATDGNGKAVTEGVRTSSNSITFSFTGTDNVAVTGFECALDTAAFTSCTSPKTYSSLTDGTHTFKVRAKDAANNVDSTPASRTWTVDTVKPTVASTNPANGATNIVVTANILATFSEAMNPTTITGSTFTLKEGSTTIGGTVSLSTDGKTATFDPTNPLLSSKLYTATITTGVKDVAGNSLAANKVWTFTTQAGGVIFTGVLQPINQDGSSRYDLGKNIPVKLQLKNSAGQFITNAKLTFTAQRISPTVTGTVAETQTSSSFTAGSLFSYNSGTNTYQYDWKTNPLFRIPGTYAIKIIQDYGTPNAKLLQGPSPPTASGETVRLSLR